MKFRVNIERDEDGNKPIQMRLMSMSLPEVVGGRTGGQVSSSA